MGNNLKFNSSVCTTREQSQRLLEMGLKPETADCMHSYLIKDFRGREVAESDRHYYLSLFNQDEFQAVGLSQYEKIPAWSLHRLIEILDSPLIEFNVLSYNPYEEIIAIISECIENGYISKEYLKQ